MSGPLIEAGQTWRGRTKRNADRTVVVEAVVDTRFIKSVYVRSAHRRSRVRMDLFVKAYELVGESS